MIKVRTQEELDKALAKTNNGADELIVCLGRGQVVARENASVVARGNASVEAWENASVVAWENASVVAWGNASVEARGNASVVARGNAFTRALSPRCKVKASASAIVARHDPKTRITGGQIIEVKPITTAKEWCDFYGVEVKRGVAILYKAVEEDYATRNGVTYTPGTKPEAPDWDGGEEECGGGLHFSPHPRMAREFRRDAKHFIACPVKVEDIVVHPDASMPEKVKAPRCCAPVWEVDIDGNRLEAA